MWSSVGPSNVCHSQPKSELQNSRAFAVSPAGISTCTICPGTSLSFRLVSGAACAPPLHSLRRTGVHVIDTTSVASVFACPARSDPRRLVRLLRIDGRPRSVHETCGPVVLVELEQRLE